MKIVTNLERRALLGDRQAQEECTRQGIVLPCPLCKSGVSVMEIAPHAELMGWLEYKYEGGAFLTCDCGYAVSGDNKADVIRKHNTRPAPPIGRCKDCENTCPGNDDSYIVCVIHGHAVNNDNWCGQFELKKPNCRGCAHWRGNEHDACAPCSDCDGVMEADNFCKNFEPREENENG